MPIPLTVPTDQPRILITRLSHIGDCVLTLPVVCAIRRKYPNAFIAWAVEQPSDQLIQGHQDLNKVITVPKGWLKSPLAIMRLRKELRSYKFDFTIDPQGLTKSSALAWISNSKYRIGCGGSYAREASRWLNNHLVSARSTHLVDRSLELLEMLGIENPQVEFRLPVHDSAREMADELIVRNQLQSGFALVNPGCGWLSRRWEMVRYAAVARYISDSHGIRSVISWAGEHEHQLAQQIVAESDGQAIVAPPTNLMELSALIARAAFYLGSDTGPKHIANAVGTKCVGLYGATKPEMSGAYGDGHILIQNAFQTGKGRKRDNTAMQTISVRQVCDACDVMIARQSIKPEVWPIRKPVRWPAESSAQRFGRRPRTAALAWQ